MSRQHPRSDEAERAGRSPPWSWDEALARRLVAAAARRAPPPLAARLEEEWLADLALRRGALSGIRFGLGCCWAIHVIARDHGAAAAVAAGPASDHRLLADLRALAPSRLPQRALAIVLIAVLHVAIIYAYLTGLAERALVSVPALRVGFIARPARREPPPPTLPQPKLARTRVSAMPPPRIPLPIPAPPGSSALAPQPRPSATSGHSVAPKPVNIVTGGPGAGFPDTNAYYPPVARRLGETGASVVRVCVDPRGHLTGAPALLESSGSRRLDAGALRLAAAGSGHYRPTTADGQPVTACYAFRVRFALID
jgi:protein TonB